MPKSYPAITWVENVVRLREKENDMSWIIKVPQDASIFTLFVYVENSLHEAWKRNKWRERPWRDESFADMRFAALGLFNVQCDIGAPDPAHVKKFREVYTRALLSAVTEHPSEYAYKVEDAPIIVERMLVACQCGTFNHDGRAMKAACKALGIPHTRRAIKKYFGLDT